MQRSATLRYALYRLQLARVVGECILRRGGSDALFPNVFGEDLLLAVRVAALESEAAIGTGRVPYQSVRPSVGLSVGVMNEYSAKVADSIEIPFRMVGRLDQAPCIRWGPALSLSPWKGAHFGGLGEAQCNI